MLVFNNRFLSLLLPSFEQLFMLNACGIVNPTPDEFSQLTGSWLTNLDLTPIDATAASKTTFGIGSLWGIHILDNGNKEVIKHSPERARLTIKVILDKDNLPIKVARDRPCRVNQNFNQIKNRNKLMSRMLTHKSGVDTYLYDDLERLIKFSHGGFFTTEFTYDGDNYHPNKMVTTMINGGQETTTWVFDPVLKLPSQSTRSDGLKRYYQYTIDKDYVNDADAMQGFKVISVLLKEENMTPWTVLDLSNYNLYMDGKTNVLPL